MNSQVNRLVMGQSPVLAQPGPIHFSRDRARNFEKDPSSTQAWDQFFEKGLENWDFYVVKKEAHQGSGSNFCEGPGLRLGSRLIFKARDRFFRARPITISYITLVS